METFEIKLKDRTLTITGTSIEGSEQVKIDTICNFENLHEEELDKHTLVTDLSKFIKSDNIYKLDVSELSTDILIISIENKEKLVYDEKVLYDDIINMFVSFCNECLDEHQKHQIAVCNLRFELFLEAVHNDLLEDSINHYTSLHRALNSLKTCNKEVLNNCQSCK